MALPATRPTAAFPSGAALSADQLLEIYYFLRLTRTLEDRLVALYRQTKVIGGLFRSLGQEGESVASARSEERRVGKGCRSRWGRCALKKKKSEVMIVTLCYR